MDDRSEVHKGSAGMEPDCMIESISHEVYDNFEDMHLREELLRAIYSYGFLKPSAIQQRVIIPWVKGHDVIVQAQSGTEKIETLSIAILQQIDTAIRDCQALILVPTRKLAREIWSVVMTLGEFMQIHCHACVGGAKVREHVRNFEAGCHVVVGTPGRVLDMINRKFLRTDSIKLFVLDETDVMLSRGYKYQIENVFRMLPKNVQGILLSATMSPDVLEVSRCFMLHPEVVKDVTYT